MNASATLDLIGFFVSGCFNVDVSNFGERYICRYLVKFARFGDKFDDVVDFFGGHGGLYRYIQ